MRARTAGIDVPDKGRPRVRIAASAAILRVQLVAHFKPRSFGDGSSPWLDPDQRVEPLIRLHSTNFRLPHGIALEMMHPSTAIRERHR